MKKIAKYISTILFVASLSSCNDWIDGVKNTSTITEIEAFESESTVDLYVNGFYTWLSTYGQFGDRQFSGSWTEAMTDIFKYSGDNLVARAGQPNLYSQLAIPMSPGGNLYSCWDNAYSAIRRINQFLTLEQQYATDYRDELRLQWQAQARFFRAFMNFQLAKRHGGSIILFDALPDGPNKARSTAEEVWNFIEEDLDFAAENLPEVWESPNKGRINKYAALAFKSRAMLYAERWQEAYDAANAVIKSGKYDLVPDYAQAWKGNNKEAIIEFDYNQNLGPNTQFDFNYTPSTDKSTGACGGAPTQDLVECYEKKDGTKVDWSIWKTGSTTIPPYADLEPRFAASILYPGCKWKGLTLDMCVGGENVEFFDYGTRPAASGNTCTGYLIRKLLNEDMTSVISVKSSQPWVELRYAEVLLNFAEAAYRLDNESETQNAINKVRARVKLPAKTSSGEDLWNDYMNERKIELVFEGQYFWDMNRWRLCHTTFNNYRRSGMKVDGSIYSYVTVDLENQMFDEKCYILPVPASEIRNNRLIEQYEVWK